MASIDHWHPVLKSRELRKKPVSVTLCDHEVVLFRSADGVVGALEDRCPHRRMKLSLGKVVEGRLECAYHAWSYDLTGAGRSPGNPKMRPCTPAYDAIELHGAIWIRPAASSAAFPRLDVDGLYLVSHEQLRVRAPLELVVDNFVEVEHTPSVHALLGYGKERMAEVEVKLESTETTVRVYNAGPQKPLYWPIAQLFQLRTGDLFVDDWTVHFSPLHAVYDQYWSDMRTKEPRPHRLKIYVFFIPVSARETRVRVFTYAIGQPGPLGWLYRLTVPVMRMLVRKEIALDCRLLEQLAGADPDLNGMQLGRFDRPLREIRSRIDRLYRGVHPGAARQDRDQEPDPQLRLERHG